MMEKEPGSISISYFEEDVLEANFEAMETNRGTGSKTESNKGQDKSPIWDGDIFKLRIVFKKLYT